MTNFTALLMSQTFEDFLRSLLCVRRSDVGLDCDCVVFRKGEKRVMDETILQMFEFHGINPEEMTKKELYLDSLKCISPRPW
jgi:hypothetical protein